MNKLQRQVREFHKTVVKQPFSPAQPMLRMPELRSMLIGEEAFETICALVGEAAAQSIMQAMMIKVLQTRAQKRMAGADLVEAIDGCGDLLVVTYGTFEAIGVDAEPFTDEIMRSNMDKVGGPVDAHGKMGKPPGWRDADIAGVLAGISPCTLFVPFSLIEGACETCGYSKDRHQ